MILRPVQDLSGYQPWLLRSSPSSPPPPEDSPVKRFDSVKLCLLLHSLHPSSSAVIRNRRATERKRWPDWTDDDPPKEDVVPETPPSPAPRFPSRHHRRHYSEPKSPPPPPPPPPPPLVIIAALRFSRSPPGRACHPACVPSRCKRTAMPSSCHCRRPCCREREREKTRICTEKYSKNEKPFIWKWSYGYSCDKKKKKKRCDHADKVPRLGRGDARTCPRREDRIEPTRVGASVDILKISGASRLRVGPRTYLQ